MWVKVFYAIGIVTFLLFGQWLIETLGEHHYEIEQAADIFDIAHKYLPDLHYYQWIINIVPIVLLVWILFIKDTVSILMNTLIVTLTVLIIRALTAVSTILPKHEKCKVEKKFWNAFQGGGCYDKIFSGHMAVVTILLLNLLTRKYITISQFWGLSLVEALTILLTRGHYTADVILGFAIAYLVYDGEYRLFKF
jgi:hypothetical protein